MKPSSLCRTVPLWVPLSVVGLTAAAVWGILTILGSSALPAVPGGMQSVVLILASVGNIMTALGAIALWPLMTAAFWSMGVLIAHGEAPEYRELANGIGLAHLPAMMGVLTVWGIVVLSDLSIAGIGPGKDELRHHLESLLSVRICRCLVGISFLATAATFVWVIRDLFDTSLSRAAAIVLCPLGLYYLSLYVI